MKKSTTVYFILFTVTLVLLTSLISINNLRTKPYRKLEEKVVESMKKYYGQDTNLKKLPKNNEEVKITLKELSDFGLNIGLKVNDDICDGYGIVTGLNLSHEYKAFIKCNKYITKNY